MAVAATTDTIRVFLCVAFSATVMFARGERGSGAVTALASSLWVALISAVQGRGRPGQLIPG